MLEKYEQKMLLHYLLEGFMKYKKNQIGRNTKRKLENLVDNINEFYEKCSLAFYLEEFDEESERETSQTNNFYFIFNQLKNHYKKFKNAKPSRREWCLRKIQAIFSLTQEEADIFALLIRKQISNTFEDCLCIDGDTYTGGDTYQMCRFYLNKSSTHHFSIKHLLELGLLVKYPGGGINLSEVIKNIFIEEKTTSTDKIVETILGKKIKTTLTKKDFEHLKDEFNMLQKILSNAIAQNKKGINILFYGEVGTGKTEFAKVVAKYLKLPLYEVCYEDKNREEGDRSFRIADLNLKNSIFMNFRTKQLCLFDEAEDVFKETPFNRKTESKAYINKMLETNTTPVIWTTNDIYNMDKAFLRRFTYSVKFDELSDSVQLKFFKKEFKKNKFEISDEQLCKLSKKYDLSSSVITNSIMLTQLTGSDNEKIEEFIKKQVLLLNRGIEKGENFNMNKKSENYNFDLVNTDIKMENLTEKIKATGNLNFSLCLYGEAGTGKSEYAKQLATALKMEVVFRRASDLMSKWVGETEQNIALAFKEARDKKAVLIFDEADSLLQSRNNAQRSWEISQVNEMLTWMESHPYPFICTTNFMESLDEASLRRFTFKIKFKYMTSNQVKLAFKHFFGKEVTDEIANIKGLTAGDFATVKKKITFLGTDSVPELKQMLEDEVKVKKSKELSTSVGF